MEGCPRQHIKHFNRGSQSPLCDSLYCDVPNIPEFPPKKGPEAFHGKLIHSMDYAAMDYESAANFVKGKEVVVTVVGFQKSAVDIAMEWSVANGLRNPCTVLYWTEQWNVPANLSWGVPLACLCLNGFSELLVRKPGEGFLPSLLATMLSPLVAFLSLLSFNHTTCTLIIINRNAIQDQRD
ncbi:hypothetical protein Dsin_029775 [Dipteronia sinensis]|uniref:Flavin-containing monooxygenase n=1 Tax=Dipteronia sinensis TaxID=43782 RepID=A0AAD9ZTQ6_9ROSI|nr:hypothetical protein Dsin_029775 [Dipteronia sinensis]